MISTILKRLQFAIRYQTFKKIIVKPDDPDKILICHKGALTILKRRCPHQGAPLETGYFKGNTLLCPWHGCKFALKTCTSKSPLQM